MCVCWTNCWTIGSIVQSSWAWYPSVCRSASFLDAVICLPATTAFGLGKTVLLYDRHHWPTDLTWTYYHLFFNFALLLIRTSLFNLLFIISLLLLESILTYFIVSFYRNFFFFYIALLLGWSQIHLVVAILWFDAGIIISSILFEIPLSNLILHHFFFKPPTKHAFSRRFAV